MTFTLDDALPLLRCPVTGATLTRTDDALVTSDGRQYPIVDGIVDLTEEAQRYDRSVSDYDAIAGLRYNFFLFNPFTMSFTWGPGVLRVPLLMKPAREITSGVVLDVPCGTGIFTARAYKKNRQTSILAVDFSMGMLRVAKRRAKRLGVNNAVFIRADVARLPIADGCLDGCISMAGFHAFPDPAAAASQIGRVLKRGATVTASVACSGERLISDFMIEKVMKPMGYFQQGLPESAYRQQFEQGGFNEVKSTMAGAVAIIRGERS